LLELLNGENADPMTFITELGLAYRSHRQRNGALPHWLDDYNHRRPHSAIGDRPPISRVHNVPG
jgi:transposase InsO family protein